MSKIEILTGDAAEKLRELPACHFHCVITSPPYFGLRDYGVDGQAGQEATPGEYVANMVRVFREVWRVLRDDGSLWLNIGDSYNGAKTGNTNGGAGSGLKRDGRTEDSRLKTNFDMGQNMAKMVFHKRQAQGLDAKNLLLLPQRLAIALQEDGWIVRQAVVWAKPNPMPESVRDRCTKSHEYFWHLVKQPQYHWDHYSMQEEGVYPAGTKAAKGSAARKEVAGANARPAEYKVYSGKRNKRSVWTVTTKAFPGAHFATFPPDLIEPAIRASTSERGCCVACGTPWQRHTSRGADAPHVEGSALDRFGTGKHGVHRKFGSVYQKWLDDNPLQTTGFSPSCECVENFFAVTAPCRVLDPFGGAGTTALVAAKHGLDATLIELNPAYVEIARRRLGLTADLYAGLVGLAEDAAQLRSALRYWRYQAEYELPVPC